MVYGYKLKIWTEDETKNLNKYYPNSTKDQILNALPGRTWSTISRRASDLKITRISLERAKKAIWVADELDILRKHYARATRDDLMQLIIGKTWKQIQRKANMLKLKRDIKLVNKRRRNSKLENLLQDTPEAYYWIGFLTADGEITNRFLKFELAQKDRSAVENFAAFIESNVIHDQDRKEKGKVSFVRVKDIDICPKIMDKFNFKLNKTYNPPCKEIINKMDNKLFLYYLIGMIDGDGYVKVNSKNSVLFEINLEKSWLDILKAIELKVYSVLKIYPKYKSKKLPSAKITKSNYARIKLGDHRIAICLKKLIQKENLPVLGRKWNTINTSLSKKDIFYIHRDKIRNLLTADKIITKNSLFQIESNRKQLRKILKVLSKTNPVLNKKTTIWLNAL